MLALVLAPAIALASPPPPPDCGAPKTTQAAQHAPLHAQKLGDLPDAEMDLAVIRSVDGCWVREVVRFKVSDRGPAGALATPAPTPGYRGVLVPDGAVAKTQPVGR